MKKNQNKTITKIGVTVLLIACMSIGLSATLYFLNTKIANGSEISTDTVNISTSTDTVNNNEKIFNHIRVPKPKINDLIRDSINKKNKNYDTNKVITNSTISLYNGSSYSSTSPLTEDDFNSSSFSSKELKNVWSY